MNLMDLACPRLWNTSGLREIGPEDVMTVLRILDEGLLKKYSVGGVAFICTFYNEKKEH